MTKICKTKGCDNEIPDGDKHKRCKACRSKRIKTVRDGAIKTGKVVGGAALAVGGAVATFGKDKVVDVAKTIISLR